MDVPQSVPPHGFSENNAIGPAGVKMPDSVAVNAGRADWTDWTNSLQEFPRARV